MSTVARLHSPRLIPLRLPALTPTDLGELTPHRSFEMREITGTPAGELDLTGVDLTECRLDSVTARRVRLRAGTLVDVSVEQLDAPVLEGPQVSFRNVHVSGTRIGSAELYDATWRSVHFTGCKLGYLNLRGSRLDDVRFTDCRIEELDLAGARVTRVAFTSTDLEILDVSGATLAHTDLRELTVRRINGIPGLNGATMSSQQISDLAPALAAMIGIRTDGEGRA